jgi:hypothetical protein
MAGLFGLFGKKSNKVEGAYFLNPDEAKTFGDIDYMRTSKTTRRTFPKTLSNSEGGELIQEVSSEKIAKKDSKEVIKPKSTANNSESDSFTPRINAKTDTNMDMFRNMAKNIKK